MRGILSFVRGFSFPGVHLSRVRGRARRIGRGIGVWGKDECRGGVG